MSQLPDNRPQVRCANCGTPLDDEGGCEKCDWQPDDQPPKPVSSNEQRSRDRGYVEGRTTRPLRENPQHDPDSAASDEQRVERSYSWVNPRDYGDDGLAIETGDRWPDDGEILIPKSLYDTATSAVKKLNEGIDRTEDALETAISERDERKWRVLELQEERDGVHARALRAEAELERVKAERDEVRAVLADTERARDDFDADAQAYWESTKAAEATIERLRSELGQAREIIQNLLGWVPGYTKGDAEQAERFIQAWPASPKERDG